MTNLTVPQIIETLEQRKKHTEYGLIEYIRECDASIPSEQLMGRVRYTVGRLNEIDDIIELLRTE